MTTTDTSMYYTHRWSPRTDPLPPADLPAGARVLVEGDLFGDDPGWTCKVCGNWPDETGLVEHGRGCYVVDSDGGGFEVVDESAGWDDTARDRVYTAMALRPEATFLLLTGEPGRMAEYLRGSDFEDRFIDVLARESGPLLGKALDRFHRKEQIFTWPQPHVWPGVRLATQADADRLLPGLLRVPAARRWVLCEPTELVNLTALNNSGGETYNALTAEVTTGRRHKFRTSDTDPIGWVVVPRDLQIIPEINRWVWLIALRAACRSSGVPLWCGPEIDGRAVRDFPE